MVLVVILTPVPDAPVESCVAVIIPAEKLPEASRATIADAVLASVAVVALLETLSAVEIVASLVSTIPADALISASTITPAAIAVALPEEVTSPVKFAFVVTLDAVPVRAPTKVVAVIMPAAALIPAALIVTPEPTTILVKEILSSRLTVTVLPEPTEVRLVPPEMVKVSLRRSIFTEPESPETVNAVPTAAVVTAVINPLALTVTTGIKVCEPKVPILPLTVANVVAVLTEVISPVKFGILVVVMPYQLDFQRNQK